MSEPDEQNFEAIDRLVRAHLDHETARTDATHLRSRLCAGLLRNVHPAATSTSIFQAAQRLSERWSLSLGWSLVASLLLIGAFFSGHWLGSSQANAATLLGNVRTVHSQSVDRCYRVHYAPDPRYWDRTKTLEGPSESVLWTRGDRFWSDCTIGAIRLAIGREEDGTLWVSPSRSKGIRFSGKDPQLPREVAVICAINSLTVPALVDDVLADFDLHAERPSPDAKDPTSLVWARLKPGRSHPLISAALLEIDSRRGALFRLVLWTVRKGRPSGNVTYTLLDSATRSDQDYRLQSHLDPGAEIEFQSFGRAGASSKTTGK